VGVDEPECSIKYLIAFHLTKLLKLLYGHSRETDVHQFLNMHIRIFEQVKDSPVQRLRQQVYPRKKAEHLPGTGLLMTSKRHLPGRESEECHPTRCQKCANPLQKTAFVLRSNVLHHVVHQHHIKRLFRKREIEEIGPEECPFSAIEPEIVPCIFNFFRRKVHACHIAADQRKGQEIPAFAASHFQNTCALGNGDEPADIIDIEGCRGLDQFIKVLMSVLVSVSHPFRFSIRLT